MSLDRFTNIEEIKTVNGKVRAITWNKEDYDLLQLELQTVKDSLKKPVVEVHLYTTEETPSYITGGIISDFQIKNNKIFINYKEVLKDFGIERGQFEVVVNIYNDILENGEELYIYQISIDRREVWLKSKSKLQTQSESEKLSDTIEDDISLNFGNNEIYKVINFKPWKNDGIVVRLYSPLPDKFKEKQSLHFIDNLCDSYIDNIDAIGPGFSAEKSKIIKGPNFNIDSVENFITETDFKSWNSLLDANTSTSQKIIDTIFSGSLNGTNVNVDYSGFQNFIHFSSATERLANFKYKLGLIEYYDSRLNTLNSVNSTTNSSLNDNISITTQRRDSVVGSFDGFERWLYNSPTSSLFTHFSNVYDVPLKGLYSAEGGYVGAHPYRLTSWPKYLSGSKYYLHATTDAISENWYNGFYSTASLYDSENDKSLVKTIPEHIRLDPNNSQYELFVNMIGHHFDILYSYIENLTRVYKPEENPKIGQSKDTLFQIAKSLGWTLANGKQASQLWKYALGVDSGSGAFQSTGDMFSKSDEEITTEIWRRIVNNLPYLLKTKGTKRSIKALMNTYGIPQTLLSIREYGGPKVDGNVPTLIEDRFSYALQFNNGAYIKFPNTYNSSSIGTWGIDRGEIPIRTHQFRFKPSVTQSMFLMSNVESGTENKWVLAVQHTGSYSGSGKFGRLHFALSDRSTGGTGSFTEYIPLYDGNYWNVQISTNFPVTASSTSTTFTVRVQQASDYISEKIVHSSSLSITPGAGNSIQNTWANSTETQEIYLGITGSSDSSFCLAILSASFGVPVASGSSFIVTNTTGNAGSLPNITFSGSIQEYRGWLEEINKATFDIHTLNPASYVSSLSPTSSYDTLIRHYPLGTDLVAVDRSSGAGLIISSSHPAQHLSDFSPPFQDGYNSYASASGFSTPLNSERGNYIPVEETYYIQGVSVGGNVQRSQKIRLENNYLIRNLSATNTSERSSFDRAPVDTNKLGLYYSTADQINKEIFNQIGDVELDDYIGDPDDDIKTEYPDLIHFSKQYWKKYTNKNDINAFLRIFSQFDFALFHQIKQLLPERVDENMGVLVEPYILERSKIKIINRPIISNPQYDAKIHTFIHTTESVLIPEYSGSINNVYTTTGETIYHKQDNGYSDTGNYLFNLSIKDPYKPTTYKHIYTIFPYQIASASAASLNLPFEITSSLPDITTSPTGSIILNQRSSDIFKKVNYFYGTGSATTKRGRDYFRYVSESLGKSYSQSLSLADYRDDFAQQTENQKYEGCKLTGPGINIDSEINAIDRKPVVEIFLTNPNTLVYSNVTPASAPGTLEVR